MLTATRHVVGPYVCLFPAPPPSPNRSPSGLKIVDMQEVLGPHTAKDFHIHYDIECDVRDLSAREGCE